MKSAGLALLGLAAAVLLASGLRAKEAAIREGETAPILSAPEPLTVVDAKGRAVDLREELAPDPAGRADPRGATLLVFWASWCQPCIHEIPVLNELHRFYGEKGLRLIGLGVNHGGETLDAITGAASKHGVRYPVLFDSQGKAGEAFGVRALPTSVLIDGRGVVRWTGPALPSDINGRIKAALGLGEASGAK